MGAIKNLFYQDEKQSELKQEQDCSEACECQIVKWLKKIYHEISRQFDLIHEESRRLREAKEEVFKKFGQDIRFR